MRNILAIVFGLIIGGFLVGLSETIAYTLFPGDMAFPAALADRHMYMEQIPFTAQLSVIIGWASGAFIAGVVTTLIQGRTDYRIPLITVGVLQLFAWMNMISFPHPGWMWVAGSLVFVPLGLLAYVFFRKRPGQGAEY